jgi:hypothetical protein
MKFDKQFDYAKAFREIQTQTRQILKEPFSPSWASVLQDWKIKVPHLPPRSFAQITDVRDFVSNASYGFSLLGYPENYVMNPNEFIQLIHENQRALFAYQTFRLYELLLESPKPLRGKGFVYCCIRSFQDAEGKYLRVQQTSYPVQFDVNERVTKYISIYTILGNYNGEPLENEFFVNSNYPEEQRILDNWQKKVKADLLGNLGFSRRQEEVITLMAGGASTEHIAETMGIQPRAVEKLRGAILENARRLFPLNKFEKTTQVIEYLKRQQIA